MMQFDVVVNYKGKEYVKLNESLGQADILGLTSKQLKEILKPLSTKLKGLGNTLYVLKANVSQEPTQVDEEVAMLRKHKEDLLKENLRLREYVNERWKEEVKIREEYGIEIEKLEEENDKLEIKIGRLQTELEIAKMGEEHWKKCSEEANAKYYDKIAYDFSYELSKAIFVDCEPDIYDEVFSIYRQYKPSNEEELRKNYK